LDGASEDVSWKQHCAGPAASGRSTLAMLCAPQPWPPKRRRFPAIRLRVPLSPRMSNTCRKNQREKRDPESRPHRRCPPTGLLRPSQIPSGKRQPRVLSRPTNGPSNRSSQRIRCLRKSNFRQRLRSRKSSGIGRRRLWRLLPTDLGYGSSSATFRPRRTSAHTLR
jgi:hypothetical protein